MSRYSRSLAWGVLGVYVGLIGAGIAVGHYLVTQPLTWGSGILIVAVSVFIGTRLRGINNIVHECSHASFAERREDNVLFGKICSALLTGCFTKYREDHLSHHAHLGDYAHDAELGAIERFGLHEPLTPRTILRHVVTPLLGRHLPTYSGVSMSARDGTGFVVFKVALLVAIAGFAALEPMTALLFVIVPLFYIFPTLNFWTDCLDHAGLVGARDELDASRNVLAPAPVRLVFFPRNDCYHLVHHLFPQVPARHLKDAHVELSRDPDYAGQPLAVRPVLRGLAGLVRRPTSS